MPERGRRAGTTALREFEAEWSETDVQVPPPFAAAADAGGPPRRCAHAEAAVLRARARG
jgi:hypothetical protein